VEFPEKLLLALPFSRLALECKKSHALHTSLPDFGSFGITVNNPFTEKMKWKPARSVKKERICHTSDVLFYS